MTSAQAAWEVVFFRRHRADDPSESIPGVTYIDSVPLKVVATFEAILSAVAEAPPPRFAGGGQWEAMHGSMKGVYEARTKGADARLHRLFCVLEREPPGLSGPVLVVITGMSKPRGTAFSEADYRRVTALVEEFRARVPRSVSSG